VEFCLSQNALDSLPDTEDESMGEHTLVHIAESPSYKPLDGSRSPVESRLGILIGGFGDV
jgi:hypothetical protein